LRIKPCDRPLDGLPPREAAHSNVICGSSVLIVHPEQSEYPKAFANGGLNDSRQRCGYRDSGMKAKPLIQL
jgi:hypothetical protein